MRTLTWLYKSPLLLLVLFSLFIRWPFFFRDYIDKDESTFILMGQAWADGYLPYTFLWDLKPPLVFLFFAQIISLFGKSLIIIRLIGALIVALNGFLLYLISKKHFNASLSLLLAILTVAVQSLFGSVQGVMSEHLCLAAILGGCYLTFEKKNYWLGAILFSLAFYCKMNVAYGMLPAFLYFFLHPTQFPQNNSGSLCSWWGPHITSSSKSVSNRRRAFNLYRRSFQSPIGL